MAATRCPEEPCPWTPTCACVCACATLPRSQLATHLGLRPRCGCSWETDTPLLTLRVTTTKPEVLASLVDFRSAPDSAATSVTAVTRGTPVHATAANRTAPAGPMPVPDRAASAVADGGGTQGATDATSSGGRHPLAPPNSRHEDIEAGNATSIVAAGDEAGTVDAGGDDARPTQGRHRHRRHKKRHTFDAGPNTVTFHRPREAAWHELQQAMMDQHLSDDNSAAPTYAPGDSELADVRQRHHGGWTAGDDGATPPLGASAVTARDLDVRVAGDSEWDGEFDLRGRRPLTVMASVVGDSGINQLCNLTSAGAAEAEQVFR